MRSLFRLFLFALLLLPALALAQTALPDPTEAPGELVSLLAGLTAHPWAFGTVLAYALTGFLRAYGAGFVPWFGTRTGGVVLAVLWGVLGTLGAALAAGLPLTPALIGEAIGAALLAMGFKSATKNVGQDVRGALAS